MSRPCPRPLIIEPQKRLKTEAASRFRANPDAPDNPYSRAQNPVHCDPGHGHPKRPVSLVEARELGLESVGRLSILCNHSLSRSKLLKQLRFLFFQRIPDAPEL